MTVNLTKTPAQQAFRDTLAASAYYASEQFEQDVASSSLRTYCGRDCQPGCTSHPLR